MLPNGITGFRNLKDSYIPEQEKRIFQRFCYSIATRYHCEVLSFDLDLASKNFYSAEIKAEQGRFYLLENAYYPWIAFAKNLDFTKIEFVESPFNLTDTSVNVLERDLANPSLNTLRTISAALDVPLFRIFMDDTPQSTNLVRPENRKHIIENGVE